MGRMFAGAREDALWRAASKLDDAQVRALLILKPDTPHLNQHHDTKGTTPLMAACRNKKSRRSGDRSGRVVQLLIEFGAHVNAVDTTGHKNTALHYAAFGDATVAVEYLLHAGADALALNHKRHTPLDVARLRNRKSAAATLTSHLSIKSGWFDVNTSTLLPLWKRRWVVALACNVERTRFELCVFHSPDDALPELVLHIDPASRAELIERSSSVVGAWLDKPFMFTLSRPLTHQGVSHRQFSRDPITGMTQGHGTAQIKNVQFAVDSEQSRYAWMALLGNGAHLQPTPTVFATAPLANESFLVTTGSGHNNSSNSVYTAPPPPHENMSAPPPGRHSNFAQFVVPPSQLQSQPLATAPFHVPSGGFSPPPRAFLDSPTTIVPAFSNVTLSSEAPSVAHATVLYHSPNAHVSSHQQTTTTTTTTNPFVAEENALFPRSTETSSTQPPAAAAGFAMQPPLAPAAAASTTTSNTPAKVGGSSQDCVICMDAVRDAICVPCGHIAGCFACLAAIKRQSGSSACCPICRSLIATVVRIYDC